MSFAMTSLQKEAVEKFARLKVGAVFTKQGSGKTRIGLELARHNSDRIDLVIFITACSVKNAIRAEVERWQVTVPVEIVGYETLSLSDREFLRVLDLVKTTRVMLIADESIFVKNPDAKRTQRVKQIRTHCDYALILNGSPITRDLWDLYWQFDLLSPKIIGQSPAQFKRNYFTHVRYRKTGQDTREFYKVYEPNVAHLTSLIAPYTIEADFDFPHEINMITTTHPSTYRCTSRYEKMRERTLEMYARNGGVNLVAHLSHLNKIANNDPGKHDKIKDAIAGQRCLVYTPWRDEQDALATGGDVLVMNGDTPFDERVNITREFADSSKPLILTYGVGAFGLNLQASHMIHFASLTFDYAHMDHAKARVRRLGQTRDIDLHYHLSDKKISRTIWANIDRKDWLAEIVRGKLDLSEVI